jgi:hypothetical protein
LVGASVEGGLVGGDKIHMDGSFVNANASMDSIRTGSPELMEQLRKVY